jgi:hypothetical protein
VPHIAQKGIDNHVERFPDQHNIQPPGAYEGDTSLIKKPLISRSDGSCSQLVDLASVVLRRM